MAMRHPQALRVPRPVGVLFAATLLLFLGYVAHAAMNVGGDALDPLFQKWVNDAVPAGCALVVLARAWRVRAERTAWLLIASGIVAWTVGNVYYSLYLIDDVLLKIPSVADGLWLAEYPVTLIGVLLLMRSRRAADGARVWLDGGIAGLALAALSAAVVLPPVLSAAGGTETAAFLTNVAYPVGDMVLLGTVATALAQRHWRLDRMWGTLALGVVFFIVADGYFLVGAAKGTYVVGTIADAGWLLCGLLLAFAAWQPVERDVARRRQGRWALVFPSLFGAIALLLLIWDHVERLNTVAIVLASASVTAVLVRMTFTLSENLRMLRGLREEAEVLALKNEHLLEVDRLKDERRHSQKMEALGQLAGGIAHDFNNLLMVVTGHTELLRMKLSTDRSVRGELDAIATAAERAADLTGQLLTFSRHGVIEGSYVDLNDLVRETKVMLASAIGSTIHLETTLADGVAPVQADRGQISQVLVNLVLNARDAMPHGGRIEIATGGACLDDLADAVDDGVTLYATLTVTDTGMGIDEATRTRIFEPFFTTKETAGGTGLGLATVYGIVDNVGGSISVESVPGVGSTFIVSLPAAVTASRALAAADPTPADRGTSSLRVLLVEDGRVVRELVERQLESLGHHVVTAPTSAQALELFGERAGYFDLLITDVLMPGIDGWQLANQLRELRSDLPVVLISGFTDGVVRTFDTAAPTAFLQKPFTIEDLAAKMQLVAMHTTRAAA
jgi:signal transduction histidine kinase/CheY-like chemotaxis protein